MKRRIAIFLSVIFCLLSIASVAGQGYPRNIAGEFSALEVNVNNIKMPLFREPFVYEGEVYLPIMDLSQWLYINANYDQANRRVQISTGGKLRDSNTRTFAGYLSQKDYEIQVLNQELEAQEKKAEEITGLPYRKINSAWEMEDYLQDNFKRLYGIPMTMDFRHLSGSRYRLYITFPSRDRKDFEDLSRRTIEEWLEDIHYAIRYLYDYRARLDGHIRDNASSYRTYLSFESDRDYLDIRYRTYASSSRRRVSVDEVKLEKHLEDKLPKYSGIDFDYRVDANPYDIDLIVYFDDKDFYDWSSSTRRNFLNRLERVIRDYDKRIDSYGQLVDSRKDEEVLRFHFLDRRVDFYEYEPRRVPVRPIEEAKPEERAPTVVRDITGWFNSIGLEVDGSPFAMLKEPIVVDEEVYMPISDLADSLYWVYEYLPQENLVKIFDHNFDSANYLALGASLLKEREQTIDTLLLDLELKKEDLERERSSYLPYRNILSVSRMQTYLRDYFEDFEGLDMNISFSRSSGNRYRLRISYNRDDFEDFDSIRRGTIEGWVEDMYEAVLDLYDSNARISGHIRSSPYHSRDYPYITFDTDYGRKLSFDFEDHGNQGSSSRQVDARKLERELDRDLRRYRSLSFRYEVKLNRSDIDLDISCINNNFYRWDIFDKIDYLRELREVVSDLYGDISINGKFVDTGREDEVFRFSIERGNIRSYDLLEDIEKYLDRNYGQFTYGGRDFDFTYKLWEKDSHTIDMKLEGDFFRDEADWDRIINSGDNEASVAPGYQAFEDFVLDSLVFVAEFFDIEISGEAVDKAYSSLLVKNYRF